ncbi:M23 family metallopeptidase [Saccharopolyspora griseoalba]|uniref:M23 family metallopeptidase n=1 Tax=Saccharopolyspora griseoalba TaxID=1431848 RepID=A0ABW2LHF1_9PSEU
MATLPGRKANIAALGLLLAVGLSAGAGSAAAADDRPGPQDRATSARAQVPRAESGEPAKSPAPWVAPTWGEISSGFGMRWGSMHEGVDIANEVGTPIRAASAGTVIDSGPASGYGLWVRIDHGRGRVTTYGHVDATRVHVGQKVESADPIATLGNRGQSTGPHLHFQIDVSGKAVDPVAFYGEPEALTDWPGHPSNS